MAQNALFNYANLYEVAIPTTWKLPRQAPRVILRDDGRLQPTRAFAIGHGTAQHDKLVYPLEGDYSVLNIRHPLTAEKCTSSTLKELEMVLAECQECQTLCEPADTSHVQIRRALLRSRPLKRRLWPESHSIRELNRVPPGGEAPDMESAVAYRPAGEPCWRGYPAWPGDNPMERFIMANSAPDVDFPEQVQALEAAATPIMPDFNLINGGRFPNVLQDFFWDQVELRLNQNQGLVIAYILAETAA